VISYDVLGNQWSGLWR